MIWNKIKKPPMSAFTVFSSDCIPFNNLIDGLGWSWGGGAVGLDPAQSLHWMGRPPGPPTGRPRWWVGGAGGMPERRQEESYIHVRPTFHQSKTIHSILCKRLRLNVHFRSQVWCLARRTPMRQLAKLCARWPPSTGWGHGSGCHLESLSQKRTVSLFCVTPVVWT